MTDFVNSELQCSICNELFIQPRIINCGHIVCLFCLTQWKKEKKHCPLCRCIIVSHCRCPNIDNIIEGIVKSLPDSMKKERLNAISTRDNYVPAIPKMNVSLENQNRIRPNDSGDRTTVTYVYTSLFERPEYLYDGEVSS